jgi:hypothetical protein
MAILGSITKEHKATISVVVPVPVTPLIKNATRPITGIR